MASDSSKPASGICTEAASDSEHLSCVYVGARGERSALERRARPTTTGDTRLALAIIIVIAIILAKVHQQAICAMQHAIR